MFNIAICDDDKEFIKYIKEKFIEAGYLTTDLNFLEYTSGEEFIEKMDGEIDIDLLVLDIQMQGIDGNQVAKIFREKYLNTTLVFCSGIYKPSPEDIKVSPFRFLLKEYTDEKMVTEIEEIMEYLEEKKKEPYIDGYYYYNRVQLLPDDIMYISIAKRGSHIHICSGTVNFKCQGIISCRKKVEELYETLKDFNFVYAHNSYIVNLRYIKSRTKNEIQLMNGEVLTVSRSRTKELKEQMFAFLENKYD